MVENVIFFATWQAYLYICPAYSVSKNMNVFFGSNPSAIISKMLS